VSTARDLLDILRDRGQSLGTAESLTGGLLCAALTDIPGSSDVVRGAVVAYTTAVKRDVVGIDPDILRLHGAVSAETAAAMADRACGIFSATWALSTTGVAGPAWQEGKPVGTVFVGLSGPRTEVAELHLHGDRQAIREQTCERAMRLLLGAVEYPG
jgi:nicotinamide-nucleotide amidase